MVTRSKLVERLLSNPRDFSWQELTQLLAEFGYQLATNLKKPHARLCFIHAHYPPIILQLSTSGTALKRYQLEGIISLSKQENWL